MTFAIEVPKKKTSSIPVVIVLFILTVLTILTHIAWKSNFEIEVFTDFHEWLINLAPAEDFFIMKYILGNSAKAFGEYSYVFALSFVLVLASILIAYLYRMKSHDYIEAFYNGIKKVIKPILCAVLVYLTFALCYNTPFIATISNWLLNLVEGFNPFMTSLSAFITSVLNNDLGYTSFVMGSFLTGVYADSLDIVHAIYTSMAGLVQIILPSSFLLVFGLTLMKVDYKAWFKYIWLFVIGMIIILLVLFTVITYM